MNTNIQVTSTEYNLNLSGEITLYVSGNTIKVTHGSTKFETLMRGTGKVTIEWNAESTGDSSFSIPVWDPKKRFLVDMDRFIYTLKGEVYGKLAQEGGGIRLLNSAEKAILATKGIPVCEAATNMFAVRSIRDSVREEKYNLDMQSKSDEFNNIFIGDDCLDDDTSVSCSEHDNLCFSCLKCCPPDSLK